jgi:hypothetical protein
MSGNLMAPNVRYGTDGGDHVGTLFDRDKKYRCKSGGCERRSTLSDVVVSLVRRGLTCVNLVGLKGKGSSWRGKRMRLREAAECGCTKTPDSQTVVDIS